MSRELTPGNGQPTVRYSDLKSMRSCIKRIQTHVDIHGVKGMEDSSTNPITVRRNARLQLIHGILSLIRRGMSPKQAENEVFPDE